MASVIYFMSFVTLIMEEYNYLALQVCGVGCCGWLPRVKQGFVGGVESQGFMTSVSGVCYLMTRVDLDWGKGVDLCVPNHYMHPHSQELQGLGLPSLMDSDKLNETKALCVLQKLLLLHRHNLQVIEDQRDWYVGDSSNHPFITFHYGSITRGKSDLIIQREAQARLKVCICRYPYLV